MGTLSAKQLKELTAHEAFVKAALETAEDKTDDFWSNLVNESTDALRGVTRMAREQFTDWVTRRRKWLDNGHNDDRKPYAFEDYLQRGSDIAALVTDTTREFNAYSTENAVEYTVGKTVEDVGAKLEEVGEKLEKVADTVATPWFLYGGAGVVGLFALGYGLRPVVQLVGPLLGKAKK